MRFSLLPSADPLVWPVLSHPGPDSSLPEASSTSLEKKQMHLDYFNHQC